MALIEKTPFVNVIRRILATYFKVGIAEIQYRGQPTFNDGGDIISVGAPASCDDTESYIKLTRKEEKSMVKPEARLRISILRS